ncbi:unnamed protein product [Moneuplotes crassus]|uniref:Uncharacterized protein n=1 Tax=Euplotes crassus TaxID=5936 RepID=A0AAD1UN58_EUPCR|nr:unnamed protein product [Moneuplotes crassus]
MNSCWMRILCSQKLCFRGYRWKYTPRKKESAHQVHLCCSRCCCVLLWVWKLP